MRKLLIAKSSQDMQSLFEPVTSEIIGLVSQQVREVKEKKGAIINVRIGPFHVEKKGLTETANHTCGRIW